jgi:hypothetical protein
LASVVLPLPGSPETTTRHPDSLTGHRLRVHADTLTADRHSPSFEVTPTGGGTSLLRNHARHRRSACRAGPRRWSLPSGCWPRSGRMQGTACGQAVPR